MAPNVVSNPTLGKASGRWLKIPKTKANSPFAQKRGKHPKGKIGSTDSERIAKSVDVKLQAKQLAGFLIDY